MKWEKKKKKWKKNNKIQSSFSQKKDVRKRKMNLFINQ